MSDSDDPYQRDRPRLASRGSRVPRSQSPKDLPAGVNWYTERMYNNCLFDRFMTMLIILTQKTVTFPSLTMEFKYRIEDLFQCEPFEEGYEIEQNLRQLLYAARENPVNVETLALDRFSKILAISLTYPHMLLTPRAANLFDIQIGDKFDMLPMARAFNRVLKPFRKIVFRFRCKGECKEFRPSLNPGRKEPYTQTGAMDFFPEPVPF